MHTFNVDCLVCVIDRWRHSAIHPPANKLPSQVKHFISADDRFIGSHTHHLVMQGDNAMRSVLMIDEIERIDSMIDSMIEAIIKLRSTLIINREMKTCEDSNLPIQELEHEAVFVHLQCGDQPTIVVGVGLHNGFR